jgi:hypothetical protein
MSRTKTISITSSEEIRIRSYHGKTTVYVESPEVDEMLKEVAWDQIVKFIRGEGVGPDEVFADDQLHKWAVENGYAIIK